jgi:hypothetical protein
MADPRPSPQRRHALQRIVATITSFALVLVVYLAMALPVAACDCMALEPMTAYAGSPDRVIFTGTVQVPEAQGTPVVVTRWFQGEGASGIVWVKGAWGQGGASCETPLPPAGTEWIFVASRFEGEIQVNLCTPHAALGSDPGAAMLADAIATFGNGGGPAPGETPPAAPAEPVADTGIPPAVLAVGVVGIAGVLAGILLVARSRRPDEPAA